MNLLIVYIPVSDCHTTLFMNINHDCLDVKLSTANNIDVAKNNFSQSPSVKLYYYWMGLVAPLMSLP